LDEFEILKQEALKTASDVADTYIRVRTRWFIAADERSRGRVTQARDMCRELIQVGQLSNDPRATALGLTMLALIALTSESYAEALEYSEQALTVAITPMDRRNNSLVKGCALVLLRRIDDGEKLLDEVLRRLFADGSLLPFVISDPIIGVGKILHGNIADGIHWIEKAISRCDEEGTRDFADWYRLSLAEVYLQIIAGKEKPPLSTLLRNLPILLKVIAIAAWRVSALATEALKNPHLHPEGFHTGRANMILGLFYKIKKKRAIAVQHLTKPNASFPSSDKLRYSRGSKRRLRIWDISLNAVTLRQLLQLRLRLLQIARVEAFSEPAVNPASGATRARCGKRANCCEAHCGAECL
jgi:hypothetical protein